MKKFFKITGIILVILMAILFAAPFIFKGKIISIVKSEINKNINAKVDFSDISISLLRKFPKVSAAIEDLQVTGNGRFSADTLLSAGSIDIALNLMSVIKGDRMTIYSVEVSRPRIHAIVTKDGHPNWNIMKPDTAAASASSGKPFNLELKKYSINSGYISYVDSSSGMSSVIEGLNHEGSGDFTSDNFTLVTKTSAEGVSFTYGLIPYLVRTRTSINADIAIDNKTSKYTFKTDNIEVNELRLAADGFFQLLNDSTYNMDIRFNAPSTDFKNILSLIPVVYQKDFAKIKTSGKAVFNGFIKGKYTGSQLPAYNINLDIANGFFQYPDLPAPVKNINIAMKVDNPDGITDHTLVNISRAHFEMENDPFDFNLLLRSPVSDMWIDANAKGRINLGNVSRMVKLDKGTSLKGLLNADISVKGFVDAVQKQQFDKFNASGTVALNGFSYLSKDYPDGVTLDKLLMTFNPKNVTLNEAAGKYLSTTFQANGEINNLLGYALKNHPLDGIVNVKADKIDVNKFMGTDSTSKTDTSSAAPFIVPSNLALILNAQAGEVKYDNLLISNVTGALSIKDETIKLDNIKGNALDGTLAVSGSYSTRENKKHPAIALKYDVKELDVQKTFNAFNTVQKLMPIGKFLGGKLSSTLSLTGNMGKNMIPDLTTLTGNGNLFLIEGLLQKFKPLDQLADKINVSQLKNISLKEIKEEFEFNAGKVFVKPFKVKVQNIEMEIGGMHGFDQSLDYTIQIKLPRSLMGSKGNDAINSLVSQATARGIPVKLSDVVNLNVKMLGTITNPDIRFDLKETAGSVADAIKDQARDFVKAKIDSTKKTVNDTLQSLKSVAIQEAGNLLKAQLFGKKDSATVADTAKNKSSDPADRLKESGRGLIENINPFKKKK
jgi:hypothetical protein